MADESLQQRRHNPLVFVDDLAMPTLSDEDRRHVTKALRLRSGARLAVGDGSGRWRWVRLDGDADLECEDDRISTEPGDEFTLALAFAPVKGDRSDLIVQKATELGMHRVVPVCTARSVVRWDAERAAKQLARHRRIAREAAMQCRRVHLPIIDQMAEFDALMAGVDGAVLAEPGGPSLSPTDPPPAMIVVGPEGGFEPDELKGRPTVGLPGHILRTETAAIVACAALRACFERAA